MKRSISLVLFPCLCIIMATGCGDNAVPATAPTGPATNPGVPPPASGNASEVMLPPAPGESAMDGTMGTAPGMTDMTGMPGVTPPPPAQMPSTAFAPCTDNAQCPVGYCVASPNGERVCTEYCAEDEDCPEDWECRAVRNTRPDTVFICVAERQVQCLSCTRDSDCGIGEDRCVVIGRTQRCAAGCLEELCEPGYSCQDTTTPDGRADLCMPDIGSCDPCVDPDGDQYGMGECISLDCLEGDPNINPGATELCDGIDNDCDVNTDEGFDLAGDPNNCGACGAVCTFVHANAACVNSICAIESCQDNFFDIDANPVNGCEYDCIPSADRIEICDGLDNDCDGNTDEGAGAGPCRGSSGHPPP